MIDQESVWARKRYFVGARVAAAGIGLLAHLAVIGILAVEDFTLIATVLGLVELAIALFAFGIGEGLSREIAHAADRALTIRLVRWSASVATVAGIAIAALLSGASLVLPQWYGLPELGVLLLLALPYGWLSLLERFATGALRGLSCHGSLLAYQLGLPVVRVIVVVSLAAGLGVRGYLLGLVIAQLCGAIIVARELRRVCPAGLWPHWSALRDPEPPRRLWRISSLDYVSNLSATAWQRLPMIIAAGLLPAEIVGAAAIAQGLALRLGIVGDSISSVLLPRLTIAFTRSRDEFRRLARRETWEIALLVVGLALAVVLAWQLAGAALLGADKWQAVGATFPAFVAIQVLVIGAVAARRCIVVPTGQTEGLAVRMVGWRIVTFPLLLAAVFVGLDPRWVLPISMGIPALAVFWVTAQRGREALRSEEGETREAVHSLLREGTHDA